MINTSLLILLTGLIYILGFGALMYLRRQGLSLRFAAEGVALTALGALLAYLWPVVSPLVFLVILYLITMRVRLLVDVGNYFCNRRQCERALKIMGLALRLGPDEAGRRIVLINRGVVELRMGEPEQAHATLEQALAGTRVRLGALYLAAGYYNLGLACQRTGRQAEAVRLYNQAIQTHPGSLYARAADKALRERRSKGE
jgi:tetratricopeptide (TPR) repeat protein